MDLDLSNVPFDLIINILNVVVFYLIIRLLVYKPVKKFLSARKEKIDKEREELSAARGLLGMDNLVLDEANGAAYLARPGMRLDLGALAKGYIADKVKALLLSRGVKSGVIDLGRNILLIGEKPEQEPFSIGIQSPDASGELLRVLALRDKSLVTSGTYERYFDYRGQRYHHVLDPFTGFPADRGLLAVTILSGSSLLGDALSTSCLLLGVEEGLALIDSIPEAEALFVRTDGSVITSSNFPDR